MNTPSHAIINLALFIDQQPQAIWPIAMGGVLPDLPMFVMYAWAKGIRRQSEHTIWTETYWHPFWQTINHSFHSIPLALILAGVGLVAGWPVLLLLGMSMVLHSLGDLPVHNHDAHRHFFPFSNYRFISPISYWDPRYYGRWVALVEVLLVLLASLYLFPSFGSWIGKGILLAVNLFYLSGAAYGLIFRPRVQLQEVTGS
jgi:hypothetical protein